MRVLIAYDVKLECCGNKYYHNFLNDILKRYSIFGELSIIVILEDFYNLFIYKRFEGKDKIEVTNWQPCLFLRFAVSCYQCHSS